MPVTDDVLKAQCSDGVRRYTQRDTMLYAPGIGMDVSQFPTASSASPCTARFCRRRNCWPNRAIYLGEHVETHLWRDGDTVAFLGRCPERDVTVLNGGRCELNPPG